MTPISEGRLQKLLLIVFVMACIGFSLEYLSEDEETPMEADRIELQDEDAISKR